MKSKTIRGMADEEYGFGRRTRAKMLSALAYILQCAEDEENEKVWFTTCDIGHGPMKRGVVISDINALDWMRHELGTDFEPEFVLRGMQAATQDKDGYCMAVLTTHDLNSASIDNISELVYRIRLIDR